MYMHVTTSLSGSARFVARGPPQTKLCILQCMRKFIHHRSCTVHVHTWHIIWNGSEQWNPLARIYMLPSSSFIHMYNQGGMERGQSWLNRKGERMVIGMHIYKLINEATCRLLRVFWALQWLLRGEGIWSWVGRMGALWSCLTQAFQGENLASRSSFWVTLALSAWMMTAPLRRVIAWALSSAAWEVTLVQLLRTLISAK